MINITLIFYDFIINPYDNTESSNDLSDKTEFTLTEVDDFDERTLTRNCRCVFLGIVIKLIIIKLMHLIYFITCFSILLEDWKLLRSTDNPDVFFSTSAFIGVFQSANSILGHYGNQAVLLYSHRICEDSNNYEIKLSAMEVLTNRQLPLENSPFRQVSADSF